MQNKLSYNVSSAISGFPEEILFPGQQLNPKHQVLKPKMIVGHGNFLKNKITPSILLDYDISILQFPNEKPDTGYKIGLYLQSKNDCRINYSCYTIDSDVKEAIKKCCRFMEETVLLGIKKAEVTKNELKMSVWILSWLWKLQKVSWKDLVHAE